MIHKSALRGDSGAKNCMCQAIRRAEPSALTIHSTSPPGGKGKRTRAGGKLRTSFLLIIAYCFLSILCLFAAKIDGATRRTLRFFVGFVVRNLDEPHGQQVAHPTSLLIGEWWGKPFRFTIYDLLLTIVPASAEKTNIRHPR